MSNGWIVSSYNFAVHSSPEEAFKECDRLSAKLPEKKFRVIRIKNETVPRPVQAEAAE